MAKINPRDAELARVKGSFPRSKGTRWKRQLLASQESETDYIQPKVDEAILLSGLYSVRFPDWLLRMIFSRTSPVNLALQKHPQVLKAIAAIVKGHPDNMIYAKADWLPEGISLCLALELKGLIKDGKGRKRLNKLSQAQKEWQAAVGTFVATSAEQATNKIAELKDWAEGGQR